METAEILGHVDHTLLSPAATFVDIRTLCDDAVRYSVASVCISPCFVRQAHDYLEGALPICTVIGFPSGCHTTRTKLYEARDAIENGADELDAVINIGALKEGRYGFVLDELKALREETRGHILKIIIETCLLSEYEKLKMCELVSLSGADFIKTSTGFSTGGATREDVALLSANCNAAVLVKAAGGIKTLSDAEDFIALGAERLGTSRIVNAIKNT